MGPSVQNALRWAILAVALPALGKADPEAIEASTWKPVAHVELAPRISMSRIESQASSNGSRAVLASTNMNPSLTARIGGRWNREWSSALFIGVGATRYETTASAPFVDPARVLWSLGIEAIRHLTEDLFLKMDFALGNTLFVGRNAALGLSLIPVTVPSMSLGAEYTAFRGDWGAAGLAAAFTLLFPTQADSFAVQAGTRYEGEVFYARTLDRWRGRAGIFLRQSSQNTSLARQSMLETGLTIHIGTELTP